MRKLLRLDAPREARLRDILLDMTISAPSGKVFNQSEMELLYEDLRQMLGEIDDLRNQLTSAIRERETLKVELDEARNVPCSVCLGKPLASGRSCICGGKGTEQAELQGFREQAFEDAETIARLTTEQAAVLKEIEALPWGAWCMDLGVGNLDTIKNGVLRLLREVET